MSYILDALKKSEREKTLGQVPTLETVVADGAKRQSQGTPWWLNLLVFVLVLLTVLVGMYYAGLINIGKEKNNFTAAVSSSGETTDSQSAQQTQALQVEQITPEPVEQVQEVNQQINQAQQAQQQPVEETAVITETQQPELTTQQSNQITETEQVQPEATQDTNQQTIEQVANAEQTAELEEIAQAQQQTLIQQQAEELAALQQAQQQVVQEQPEQIPEQNQQAVAESNNNDYEEALHQNLRNVAVNVVSYSSDARQRFVMLDLTIYKEGDSLPNGADIVEIQRTGAIVEFQSKRYLLKP